MRFCLFLILCLLQLALLPAQIVTTDPAAPTDDMPLTITFDASQGTAGLEDCNCDVYIHTGVITPASSNSSDWQFLKTTWGVANEDWKLTPVEGEPNKYTYTFSPSVRDYFGVPAAVDIEQVALVFRDATGSREGKADGASDIFIDVAEGGGALSLSLVGAPTTATYPLGQSLPLSIGTTADATIEVYDNDILLISGTGTELDYELVFTEPGQHAVNVIAKTDDQEVSQSFDLTAILVVDLLSPEENVVSGAPEEEFTIAATSYVEATLTLDAEGTEVATIADDTLLQNITLPAGGVVTYQITASYREEVASTSVTFVSGDPEVSDPPPGFSPGLTKMADGGLMLNLRAPGKQDVFVIGNFSNWSSKGEFRMKRATNDTTFWLEIPKSALPEEDLLYQYVIDLEKRHPDPYSTLVLDPFNDQFIGEEIFADIPAYPSESTEGIVSWLRLDQEAYEWQIDDYDRPDPERMVIYELLVRDFLADHSYQSLTDTLDYLQRLGINAIELMPVQEFEGNISWGYNPSFHMALDKYYGSPEDLKAFVDACHARGLAVILDVVYNHAFGQSPIVRMWSDETGFQPSEENPYANVRARHPFNVGYDLNHESALTQEYVKTTLSYWLEEFRIDGFRFDLSKGFTQNFSANVGAWNRYDADRIAIIKDYADHVWSIDSEAFMIMEHLGESREEDELAQYGNGMYFWSGFEPHNQYLEGSMGFPSNLRSVFANSRGFSGRNLVAYMESHDEERMQYKNQEFGNSSGSYDVTQQATGLDRIALASTFFYTIPGPKMLWQFGELGYDFSINYCGNGTINEGCRTDPKPIGWRYRDEFDRQDVYNHIADLLYLRNNFDFFHGEVIGSRLNLPAKYVHLSSADGEAAVFGNFDVVPQPLSFSVPTAGTWYDYFTGETITVSDPAAVVTLAPGEFHLYLSQPLERGGGRLVTSTNDEAVVRLAFTASPNPTEGILNIGFELDGPSKVTIDLLDLSGRQVAELHRGTFGSGPQLLSTRVPAQRGLYLLRLTNGATSAVRKIVIH